jgi:hypothetical protein
LALDHYCGDIEDEKRALENYMGCYSSIADYAQEVTESTSEVPEHLKFYIDYEKAKNFESIRVFERTLNRHFMKKPEKHVHGLGRSI